MSNKPLVRSRTHFDPFCWVKSQVKWLNLHFVSGFKASITWNPQFWWSNPKFSWLTPHYMKNHPHHVSCGCFNPHFLPHWPTDLPKNGTILWVGGWTRSCCRTLTACCRVCLPCVCWPMRSSTPQRPNLGRTWDRWFVGVPGKFARFRHKIWGFSNPQKDFEESFTIKYFGRILP